MPHLVILTLPDSERLADIIEAWDRARCPGVTIFNSIGMSHVRQSVDDLPLFPSLRALFESREVEHSTVWSVVPDGFDLDALFDVTEQIVGPLDEPHTGIMFVVPVSHVRGLRRHTPSR